MLSVQMKRQLAHYSLDVRFEMKEEIVVLFGPSGSGKTTILHMIAGLTKLDQGKIVLKNRLLVENGKSIVPVQHRKIGYVFQDYALFPHKTVWDNIAYGMKSEAFAEVLMEELHIAHLKERYPNEISGGERQRTALIRALVTEPDLLLLDEPFSALDEATKQESYQQLRTLHQKWHIPIVLVSHNRVEVDILADRVYTIEKGQFVSESVLK